MAFLLLPLCVAGSWQQAVNQTAAHLQDFERNVQDYIKLRKKIIKEIPPLKPTDSSEALAAHQKKLSQRIRKARSGARQGDIFTPAVAAEFRRLISMPMKGQQAAIKQSMKNAEPVQVKLVVNQEYPTSLPLQSTPPTLLQSLPRLPAELDYRIAGQNLGLRDVQANLILDFIPRAIP
ncbi:MAG TPA: hypothetical protein VM120_29660 [Bryobacteraceae bacterium]|nr:hypothetical protein [Bryobacteraceae bacterium]